MSKEIVVNGKTYHAVEVTFNVLCDMDEMGVSIEDLSSKHIIRFLRAYIALCIGKSPEEAGIEIGNHVANGGKMDELVARMMEAFEEGGFFQTQPEAAKAPSSEDTATGTAEKKAKK